jgi:molecular chaperone GrpE
MTAKKHANASDGPSAGQADDTGSEGERGMNGSESRDDQSTTRLAAPESDLVEVATEASREESDPLAEARREAAENYDRYLRARAELDNVLKRHERNRLETAKYAAEGLARDLLVVVDDLERALSHATDEDSGLARGVELVLKSMLSVLEKHGVERIEALGKPFDPTEHEAVAMIDTGEHAPNTVIEEHRAGYRIGDRLLRPAMVAVAKAR